MSGTFAIFETSDATGSCIKGQIMTASAFLEPLQMAHDDGKSDLLIRGIAVNMAESSTFVDDYL